MQGDEQDLASLVRRGFESLEERGREREQRVSTLSDRMIAVEFELRQLGKTASEIKDELKHAEISKLTSRVEALESAAKQNESKAADNAKWIKGLVGSLILLFLGWLINFISIRLR